MNIFRLITIVALFNWLSPINAIAEQESAKSPTVGKFLGAKESELPDWFKESFLEFEEDIAEAAEENKRLLLYFHQAGCPYCDKLINDNFADAVIGKKVRENFDIVAINMWGDRDVVQVGGQQFTEKTLAAAMNVNFTPTLLFFAEDKQVALRLDGYYPSAEFLHAINYVAEKKEKQESFASYMASLKSEKKSGELTTSQWVEQSPQEKLDLSTLSTEKNLAVILSEPACETCDLLHQKVFQNESAAELLNQYHVVQVNRWSDDPITLPDGTSAQIAEWADRLNIGFAPAMVFFNRNREQIIVVDAMFKTFHVLGVFDYVASGAYAEEPSFQRYLSERAERIRHTGKDVDIWSY
ncbi:MAG: thioredoxin fold domain-containing protein [Granulosicoccus sp.]|nr:thioredoxin fold domain-containing protein [Granulosicoccus sp.]